MRLDNKKKALQYLKDRIMLLSRGITLPDTSAPVRHLQSSQGGPGPMGTVCYVGDMPGKHNSQISLTIFPKDHYMAQYALPTEWYKSEDNKQNEQENKKKILQTGGNIFLEKVSSKWQGTFSNGRKVSSISKTRFHPYRTFSLALYRTCRHFEANEQCKFCTISSLMNKLNFPIRSSNQENLEYLKIAMDNNPIRSVTMSGGTFESPERTAREMLSLAKLIRKETEFSVHIQTEPFFDKDLMKELSEYVGTIGIFLESFDEKIRKQICPGKARYNSPENYLKCWEMAVDHFGRGNVWNTNIIGFNEDYDVILKGIEKAAKIGVISSILLFRVGSKALSGITPSYIGKEDDVLKLHQELGKILVKYSVDNTSPKKAGCLGCFGCSATKEVVKWARAALGKEKYEDNKALFLSMPEVSYQNFT